MFPIVINENDVGGSPSNDGKTLVEMGAYPSAGRALLMWGFVPPGLPSHLAPLSHWTVFDVGYSGTPGASGGQLSVPGYQEIFHLTVRNPIPNAQGLVACAVDSGTTYRTSTIFFPKYPEGTIPDFGEPGANTRPLVHDTYADAIHGHNPSIIHFPLGETWSGQAFLLYGEERSDPALAKWLPFPVSYTPANNSEDSEAPDGTIDVPNTVGPFTISKRDPNLAKGVPGLVSLVGPSPGNFRIAVVFLPS